MNKYCEPSTGITAAFVQKPFQVTLRQVQLPSPGPGEALIDVLACGICGYDLETAELLADTPRPFGHEVSGIIREIGPEVKHVSPGEQVVLESSSFCGDCDTCRNGRVDICSNSIGFWGGQSLGFSEAMIVPARNVVPAPDIDPLAAALAEPCGVALDMVKVAEIGLSDRVMVVGTGRIGLMAIAIARRLTTGPIVAANRSEGKLDAAKRLGADAVVATGANPLAECGKPYGGFDRILVTCIPDVIPDCVKAGAYGSYIAYIGSDFQGGGMISLDTHAMHFKKMQLRASMAAPALYLPQALHLLRTGVVPASEIISHRVPLSRLEDALRTARYESDTARKIMVIPDARFEG